MAIDEGEKLEEEKPLLPLQLEVLMMRFPRFKPQYSIQNEQPGQ